LASLIGLLFWVAVPLAQAQTETPEDRLARLLDNRDLLNITLQLAPLEQAVPPAPVASPTTTWMSARPVQVIVYMTNPTAAALEVPDPSDPASGQPQICYQSGTLADGSPDWRCGPEDDPALGAQLGVTSRFINPGETVVAVHKSTELIAGTGAYWLGEGGLPRSEGHYSLSFIGDGFEFDILAPVPLLSAVVPLHGQRVYIDTVAEIGTTANLNMFVFAVSDNGWPTICWSTDNVEGAIDLPVGSSGRLDPTSLNTIVPIGVYALPAVGGGAPGPVVTLNATADANDMITIDYSGSDGVHHLLQLNAARRLPIPNGETISTPLAVVGPSTGDIGGSYQYTAGGATSSLGHPVQYSFDWGDGTASAWMPAGTVMAAQSWSMGASFPVAVQARCALDTDVVSNPSSPLVVAVGGGSVPTIAAVTPATANPGTTVPVIISGTNFLPGATISVNGPGVTVAGATVLGLRQISATLTIAGTATPGNVNLAVLNSAGASSAPFVISILPTPPVLTSISPSSVLEGTTVSATLIGANFSPDATVATNNNSIAISNATVNSPTQITASFFISQNAPTGPTNVTVNTSAGTSNAAVLTVSGTYPTLTAVSPASGVSGTTVQVALTGTNFVQGAKVATTYGGIAVTGVNVISPTQINATLTISATADPGPAYFTVNTGSGMAGWAVFNVTGFAPTLASVSPASGSPGTQVPVTLTGTNFTTGSKIVTSNTGISVSGVTVVSTTQITATFNISYSAPLGAANVTVSTGGGTSGAVVFTVNPVSVVAPSFNPAGGTYATAQSVTLSSTSGATILYTTDGSTPTASNGAIYTGPIAVTSANTINAVAYIGASNSALASATYTIKTPSGMPFITVLGDSYVNGALNYGGAAGLNVGAGSSALIQFNLSTLPPGILPSAIQRATVSLWVSSLNTAGSVAITQVTSPWSEATVTTSNAPTTGAVLGTVPVTQAGSWVTLDITSLVQSWIATPSSNYGIQVSAAASAPNTSVAFASKETGGSGSNPARLNIVLGSAAPLVTATVGDALVNSGAPTTNYGSTVDLNVNGHLGQSSFVTFDLSGLPAGTLASEVSQALLFLWENKLGNASGTFDVSPVTSPWSETIVTYNTAPTIGPAQVTVAPVQPTDQWLALDITNMARAWVGNPATNFGAALSASPSSTIGVSFSSKENTTFPNPARIQVFLQAVAPVFTPSPGAYTSAQSVVIASPTNFANIRYTTDGTIPTSTTGNVYTGPVQVSATTTINAIAYKQGMMDSLIVSGVYTITP
jgi:hypothetical protein